MNKWQITGLVFTGCLCFLAGALYQESAPENPITRAMVAQAEQLIGLEFTDTERDSMLEGLKEQLENYQDIREVPLDNGVPPALQFNPIPAGTSYPMEPRPFRSVPPARVVMPQNIEDLAFSPVTDLAELIRTRQVTSEALTRMYLERLKKYGPALQCVITLTETRALAAAKKADAEIAAGTYRGPLHGIPYGAKDLLAVKGYPTTWGANPYRDQVIERDATVIKKLDAAGAVLVAKLSLGALAWGDVWFGGKTRNPWNPEEGSSGSSAGSASATAAGLVGFAIGTETWGSIVSPSTRCAVSGLRPTYGRVSRAGAMALSWSMDKIGPICRSVEDCALVFNAIYGPDGEDQTVVDLPFAYTPDMDLKSLRIGYLKSAFDSASAEQKPHLDSALAVFRAMGLDLIPVELPDLPIYPISFILSAEAAAAFDQLTRSNRDDLLVRQIRNAWPNVFRHSRFIPAVEYINANRIRYLQIQEMGRLFNQVDAYIAPSFGKNLLLTNLTGHPCVVVPNGGPNKSISIIGDLFREDEILRIAARFQQMTGYHHRHPDLSGLE